MIINFTYLNIDRFQIFNKMKLNVIKLFIIFVNSITLANHLLYYKIEKRVYVPYT